MDSSVGYGPQVPEPTHCRFHQFHHHNSLPPRPHHHHHHHFQVSPHCPFHSSMLHLKNHSPSCPIFASADPPQSQSPETLASVPFPINPFDLQVSQPKETIFNSSSVMHEETNVEMEEEGEHQEEEEEEEDSVFVLTDEWREFFAKSEAKRRLGRPHLLRSKLEEREESDGTMIQSDQLLQMIFKGKEFVNRASSCPSDPFGFQEESSFGMGF